MIGDVLASTVICEALKKDNPSCEVHYMVQPNTLAVVKNNPFIDKLVEFNPKHHKGFLRLIAFGKSLKKEKYDVAIDAYGKWESVLPAFFSKAKIRIGFKKWYTSLLYSKTLIQEQNVESSAIYHRLQLAHQVTKTPIATIFPKIYLLESEIDAAKLLLRERLNLEKKIIMISVLGSSLNKSLPAKYMAKIIDVIAESDVQLLFNFMPNQEHEAKAIYNLCKPETQQKIIFDFYATSLREFLAILSQCDALIGNEGGAVNMAKALGVKTFSIYSPWINKSSWNIMADEKNHVAIHLNDYHPEIYKDEHPKKFKNVALELYKKLSPDLFLEKLKSFVSTIVSA